MAKKAPTEPTPFRGVLHQAVNAYNFNLRLTYVWSQLLVVIRGTAVFCIFIFSPQV